MITLICWHDVKFFSTCNKKYHQFKQTHSNFTKFEYHWNLTYYYNIKTYQSSTQTSYHLDVPNTIKRGNEESANPEIRLQKLTCNGKYENNKTDTFCRVVFGVISIFDMLSLVLPPPTQLLSMFIVKCQVLFLKV